MIQTPNPLPNLSKQNMLMYKKRNTFIKELNYPNYEEYLKGKEWKRTKELWKEFKNEDKYICSICKKNKAYTLHHTKYSRKTLSGSANKVTWKYIIPVCKDCHTEIHSLLDTKSLLKATRSIARKHGGNLRYFKWIHPITGKSISIR